MSWRTPLWILGLSAAVAAAWCWPMRPAFWQNAAAADLQLYALWLGVHWLVAALASTILIVVASALLRRPLLARAPWLVATLLLAILPISLAVFALQRQGAEVAAVEATPAIAPGGPILLLGLDGLDPQLLVQLIDGGLLPNFQRLRDEGCFGELATVSPHSPVVWSTIATGAAPQVHGVLGYTSEYFGPRGWLVPRHEHDLLGRWLLARAQLVDEGAVSADVRRQKAIWVILSEYGLPSLTIGWWASYPTTPGGGIQISNRAVPWDSFAAEELDALEGVPDLVEPPGLWPSVRATIEELIEHRRADQQDRTNSVYFGTRDEINWRLFQKLRTGDEILASVYLQELDTASHAYTHAVFGGNTAGAKPMHMPEARARQMFGQSVVAAYRRMDARLGEFLEGLAADESVMLVSDHGWRYDGSGHWSQPPGTLICFGPAFAQGVTVRGASVYDILPTLAALCGVPRSAELPGDALTECLAQPELATGMPVVAGYGRREPGLHLGRRGDDAAHLEKLRSLGYID